jgi:hypothetical protein
LETVEHVVDTELPLNVNRMVEFDAKPVPDALTVLPTPPYVGASFRLVVTLKDAVAVFVPSVAETMFRPPGVAGTVNVQGDPLDPGKVPFASVVQFDGVGIPSRENTIDVFPIKSVPVPEITVPTVPFPFDSSNSEVVRGSSVGAKLDKKGCWPPMSMAREGDVTRARSSRDSSKRITTLFMETGPRAVGSTSARVLTAALSLVRCGEIGSTALSQPSGFIFRALVKRFTELRGMIDCKSQQYLST